MSFTQSNKIKKIKLSKKSIIETLNEILNLKINRLIISNSRNDSFFQFVIIDKVNFFLDFPDYPTNGNSKKAEFMLKVLFSHSFKLVKKAAYSTSLKEKEFIQEISGDNILIQANCGSNKNFLSELIEFLAKKVLILMSQDLLEVEYID
ncbi:hypothetical protein COY89_01980 [Candidatus Roizmanbacteria bacterium CG_4_10_14_0_8_um_filter_36_36]|uniref:Uncharacterized protein n=1 Tax=Candidatus Roizmanbacteria bacterium CG_4_8_14_3_um_filter_36_10 TaxID=1974834 RepID=A0A2M8GMM2_9BACT|nr:MAG: hypothetical protein COY89_01980 [Candidatus Roizmanbacteria bacterium CG_4_10_14_0_8_um_filter_36_36]PJA53360.1 MAG: hypothetical protein CO166_02080 [Candidatus Roizmanbacteria bacterium CG_4_9_14_3_um_filter_36_11]PJC81778.1 MAG: hypothetical protein CO007_02925 [Candidatus Roizmanbacteria bacterium CG_4_8_14_3_um_filter_36_10]